VNRNGTCPTERKRWRIYTTDTPAAERSLETLVRMLLVLLELAGLALGSERSQQSSGMARQSEEATGNVQLGHTGFDERTLLQSEEAVLEKVPLGLCRLHQHTMIT
jgi:hypothetical protein